MLLINELSFVFLTTSQKKKKKKNIFVGITLCVYPGFRRIVIFFVVIKFLEVCKLAIVLI